MGIKIHNVMTNIVGRTAIERNVTGGEWRREIQPALDLIFARTDTKRHKALIGYWVVEYIGNDPHMHEFFVKNWKPTSESAEPEIRSYVANPVRDRELMMKLLGLKSEQELKAHRGRILSQIQNNKKFRSSLRDDRLRDIEKFPEKEQLDIALFAPATVYSAEDRSFVSVNTNYYGQLKSKSSLGPLEEFLIRKAQVDPDGKIKNPDDVWLSLHAGCIEYQREDRKRLGIVIIAPTGTGKSTHGYGLVEAKRENRLHSDDWVFVNLGSREVLISEDQFYMRTNIAEIYPHLIPLLVNQPLENVPFTADTIRLLEGFQSVDDLKKGMQNGKVSPEQFQKIVAQMVETNAARSLINPRLMVGSEKFIESTQLTDIFLFKRDYDSSMILEKIPEEKMIEILTSKDNVYNYDYGKLDPDGYGIPQARTTEIYYNPYLCICEVDREKSRYGALDQIRMEAYRTLARRGVRQAWVNTRLPANQTQFCLRRFLEGEIDSVHLVKGGRNREQEAVLFEGRKDETVTFYKGGPGSQKRGVAAYSEGSVEEFLKKYEALGAKKLFSLSS